MRIADFKGLRLVGGTSLSLQLGHRESTDIDLFGHVGIERDELPAILSKMGALTELKRSKNINIFSVDNIKLDVVNYRYPWIKPVIQEGNLRLASIEDIGAMKLNAIVGRGSKKDFIDLYFLLKKYSLKELYSFYEHKYDDGNLFLVKKSLTYFLDAENDAMPRMFIPIAWEDIKNTIAERFYKSEV